MEETTKSLKAQKLENYINDLSEILNEICCLIDEGEVNIDKLNVSHRLDTLIVEYMELEK